MNNDDAMNYNELAGVPVGGKLSVCLIWNCMKYRIIILIIIIKRLGEILLSYMANTIRDDTGRLVPFERGKVTVTMHYSRRTFVIIGMNSVQITCGEPLF